MIRLVLSLLLLTSCARRTEPVYVVQPGSVLDRAYTRPTPDPVRARLHVKLVSKPMGFASGTNAVWISDRPGRGHLAILGPLGGPVATLTSDGVGLSVMLPQEQRVIAGDDANANLTAASGSLFDLDALVGLLVGDLPFDDARITQRTVLENGAHFARLAAANGAEMDLEIEPSMATARHLTLREPTGRVVLAATFEPFEPMDGGTLVPTRIHVEVPALELTMDLRFKSWETLDELPPVFQRTPPDGWTIEPIEQALLAWGLKVVPDEHP